MADPLNVLPQHVRHPRKWHDNLYVYAVLSRRSKGISIGINLNPDKICNFDCVYCQVDRQVEPAVRSVDRVRLREELESIVEAITSGELFEDPQFRDVPHDLRRINDFAFSGDGEPTSYPAFREVLEELIDLKVQNDLPQVKIVTITNATLFHRPSLQDSLDLMMQNNGEIWAKLDAGTEEYYRKIERTTIPFSRILSNLQLMAKRHPLVIQSLFLRYEGQPPTESEIDAYIDKLRTIIDVGGTLSLVQVYTVARRPAESVVSPLNDAEVDQIAQKIRDQLPLKVETYYGKQQEA